MEFQNLHDNIEQPNPGILYRKYKEPLTNFVKGPLTFKRYSIIAFVISFYFI